MKTKEKIKIIHLTDDDLREESRNLPFDKITIKDFKVNIIDISNSIIFFIDTRAKKTWKRWITFLNNHYYHNKIKQIRIDF